MKRLTLTFDNGPVAGATERILDVLGARGVKATFFVIGERLEARDARHAAERAKHEGHWIGNHTMTHSGPLGHRRDRGHAIAEIEAAQVMLGDLAHEDRLFRPVGGGELGSHILSPEAADHLVANRYTVVTWNNVPRDWVEPHEAWVARAVSQLEQEPWTVLVVHDHCLESMMPTLVDFLDQIERRGIEIVQGFPESCVVVDRGEVRGLEGLVASEPA